MKTEVEVAVKSENMKVEKIEIEVKREVKSENAMKIKEEAQLKVKAEPIAAKPEKQFDGDGKPFWELGRNRRLYVNSFKGKEYVHIRSFYENEATG